jgi:hypothetical protein
MKYSSWLSCLSVFTSNPLFPSENIKPWYTTQTHTFCQSSPSGTIMSRWWQRNTSSVFGNFKSVLFIVWYRIPPTFRMIGLSLSMMYTCKFEKTIGARKVSAPFESVSCDTSCKLNLILKNFEFIGSFSFVRSFLRKSCKLTRVFQVMLNLHSSDDELMVILSSMRKKQQNILLFLCTQVT